MCGGGGLEAFSTRHSKCAHSRARTLFFSGICLLVDAKADGGAGECEYGLKPPHARACFAGGKELDLHQLYCQITKLGGAERVISRKLWRVSARGLGGVSV